MSNLAEDLSAEARQPRSIPSLTNGVLVLSGYGLRLSIERSHLLAEDGIGKRRRVRRFGRVGSAIKRVVVVGHAGSISLEALRWMHELDIAFVQIGPDGELFAAGAPKAIRDVRVRRSQAIAPQTQTGVRIARELLSAKIIGQLALLNRIPNSGTASAEVKRASEMLDSATTIMDLRYAESRAAAAYWTAWRAVGMNFVGPGASHLPSRWRTVGSRQSPLSGSPRKAATPAHALLNYAYAVLEAEARLAAIAVGCDPDMGIIHSDKPGRSSFACDLMEPLRPLVDAYVLHLLETRGFLKRDFFETREGVCRLMPPFTEALAQTASEWKSQLGPIAERIAGMLLTSHDTITAFADSTSTAKKAGATYRTPLTQRNRSKQRNDQAWNDRGVS